MDLQSLQTCVYELGRQVSELQAKVGYLWQMNLLLISGVLATLVTSIINLLINKKRNGSSGDHK